MKRLEEASYRAFFQLYYRRLWAYLFVVANGDDKLIEDALQLAFAKIVKKIKVFSEEKQFWAWLAVVVRNAFLDCQRKEHSFSRLKEFFHIGTEAVQHPLTPEHYTDENWLDCALSKLDDSERKLIEKKYFHGTGYRQLAQELGTTAKAIESRLARIRSKLRKFINEEVDW